MESKQASAIMARKKAEGEIEQIINQLEKDTGLLVMEVKDLCAKLQDHLGRTNEVYHSVALTMSLPND